MTIFYLFRAESEEEQSLGVGAGSMLRWIAAWRYFTRDYEGLRALMLSLISSFTYSGPEAQISMTMSQVMFALRSMRPSGPNASLVADQICMDCISIIEDARNGASSTLSGRHETITILFPLYILPDITPEVASKLMLMYVREAVSDTPLAQKVSSVAIIYMLLPLWKPFYDEGYSDETPKMSDESIAAAKESLFHVLETEGNVLLPRVLQAFATSHHNMASAGEDGQSRRSRSLGNREETVVAAALSTLVKGLEWPSSAGGFKAIVQGNFTVRHARFVQVLTMTNPGAVIRHLKSPLQSIVSQPQDVDKPSVAAAAEIMAGLIASKAVFSVSDEGSQWNLWFADTLRQALESAPLDFLNIWGDCVLRFGLNGLKEQTKDDIEEIQSIVEVALSNKPLEQAGSSSAELYKKVIYLTEVLQEMVGDATGTFPCAPKLGIYERRLIMDCLHSVPALIESSCDTDLSRQAIAGLMADASMIVLTISCSDPPGAITMSELRGEIDIMLDKIYAKFDEATALLFEKNKDKVASHSTGEAVMDVDGEQQNGKISDDREEDNALSYVAFVCELTYQFLAGASSHASPLVIRPLRNIMRVLELIPSEAQFVGSAVRLALRSSKYQPLEPEFIDQAFQSLIESSNGELWTERAAALQFMQYFWFRNVIALGQQGSERVLNEALRLLEDPKLEVREMACDTISGVIRALSLEKQAEIREKIVSRSKEIFPDRKRRKVVSNGSNSKVDVQRSLPERHGAVLALRALVISSPYDVPQWLPEILMALVRLASEPAPVKNTVREALSDFRRTHEEGGLLEVKDAMTAEQWEAVRDVAVGAASYFV
jgi:proteasome activator subunit 4